jgi:hypothetical protein
MGAQLATGGVTAVEERQVAQQKNTRCIRELDVGIEFRGKRVDWRLGTDARRHQEAQN